MRSYLPEFEGTDFIGADGNDPIPLTIEHCFVHANGLQDTTGVAASCLSEKVRNMAASGLSFAPGSQWQYSSGHDVLGRLIEIFSGQTYADFLKENVLTKHIQLSSKILLAELSPAAKMRATIMMLIMM